MAIRLANWTGLIQFDLNEMHCNGSTGVTSNAKNTTIAYLFAASDVCVNNPNVFAGTLIRSLLTDSSFTNFFFRIISSFQLSKSNTLKMHRQKKLQKLSHDTSLPHASHTKFTIIFVYYYCLTGATQWTVKRISTPLKYNKNYIVSEVGPRHLYMPFLRQWNGIWLVSFGRRVRWIHAIAMVLVANGEQLRTNPLVYHAYNTHWRYIGLSLLFAGAKE